MTTQTEVYFDPRTAASQKVVDAEEKFEKLIEVDAKEQERLNNIEMGGKVLGWLAGAFIKPAVLMLVWNWTIPALFGIVTLGYWQAFGLCFITFLLTKHDNN